MAVTPKVWMRAFETMAGHPPLPEQELLRLRMSVHPDGSESLLKIDTTSGSYRITVAFEHMSAAFSEMRQAALLMLYRQAQAPLGNRRPIAELARTAMRPARVDIAIDRATGDRLFVQQFPDRMPIVTRMAREAVNAVIEDLERVARKTAN